jgi:dolichol-phosphate mannosyltransferase
MKKLLSLVIPVHNEEKNIEPLYLALQSALASASDYEAEFIFVDDGSSDATLVQVSRLREKDPRVLVLEFSRNFGKEAATSAGLRAARGVAAIMLDADLQHPPVVIPEFLEKWEQGAEVVVGVRQGKQGAGWFKRACSSAYYKIINAISPTEITPHATDFRLLDRIVIDEVNRLTERNRMTRALVDWLGFRRDYVYFEAQDRAEGQASYGFFRLMRLAMNSVVAMSLLPLKIAGYLGIIIILISTPLGIFIFIEKYILHDPWGFNFSGPAILAVILLFLVGIVLACLGLMALYIASIHAEVINRPLYVIRRKR